jgi:pimeloyl-ACP methyl ester carboxylesterase
MRFLTISGAVLVACRIATARQCENMTIPVSISARNGVFSVSVPQTNIDVTNFILDTTQQGGNYSQTVLTGYATVSSTYDLAATYCAPNAGAGKTIQILTHGIGFDRSYWDLPFNNYNYSYVETAVDLFGYSTLSWDRLGIGMSEHGDPLSVIQAPLEQAALQALTELVRSGSWTGNSSNITFDKVVHVGHSFGSELSYGLARDDPSLSDGLVLTGFSTNGSFVPYFALGGNFVSVTTVSSLSAEYVAGYLAAGDPSGVQTNFFAPGQFDPAVLTVAYTTGQPVTVGEFLTIGGEAAGVNHFTGPVLVITGERDIPYCGGNCLATGEGPYPSIPAAVKQVFPNASDFEAFVVPSAGHGLNLEYSHPTTYAQILQFLAGVDL